MFSAYFKYINLYRNINDRLTLVNCSSLRRDPQKTKFTFTRYSFGESCELSKEEKKKEAEDIFARREIIVYLMAH